MSVTIEKKNGDVTFIFKGYPDSRQVYLAGDFNGWSPKKKRMSKYRDGTFRAKVALKPGAYQYKFVADGVWMIDPEAQQQVPDPFGGANSLISIP